MSLVHGGLFPTRRRSRASSRQDLVASSTAFQAKLGINLARTLPLTAMATILVRFYYKDLYKNHREHAINDRFGS